MSLGESCRFKVVMFEVEEEQKLRVRVTTRADERAATLRAPWYRWSNHERSSMLGKSSKVGRFSSVQVDRPNVLHQILAAHMPM